MKMIALLLCIIRGSFFHSFFFSSLVNFSPQSSPLSDLSVLHENLAEEKRSLHQSASHGKKNQKMISICETQHLLLNTVSPLYMLTNTDYHAVLRLYLSIHLASAEG